MAYTRVNWQNKAAGGTKLGATNLNVMDAGIYDAHFNAVIQADAASEVAATVKGAASQTALIFDVQKSDATSYARVAANGNVDIGRDDAFEASVPADDIPDFRWDAQNFKLRARSLMLGDVGDSPDLALRRAGNDIEYNVTSISANPDGMQICPVYWQSWDGTNWDASGQGAGASRIAGINAETEGATSETNRGGELQFFTQKQNDVANGWQKRMTLNHEGAMLLHGDANGPVPPRIRNDSGSAIIELGRTTQAIGFLGTTAATKQTVTGTRSANPALASLLTGLSTYGLITDSTTEGSWAAYVPAWTSSGTAPAIGSGTLAGRFIQVGDVVIGYLLWRFAADSSAGTGIYSFSLPVAAATTNTPLAGSAFIYDSSGSVTTIGAPRIETSTTVRVFVEGADRFTNVSPIATLATNDNMRINFCYEAA